MPSTDSKSDLIAAAASAMLAALKPLAVLKPPPRPQGNAGFYSIRFDDIETARSAIAQAEAAGIKAQS